MIAFDACVLIHFDVLRALSVTQRANKSEFDDMLPNPRAFEYCILMQPSSFDAGLDQPLQLNCKTAASMQAINLQTLCSHLRTVCTAHNNPYSQQIPATGLFSMPHVY
jgi:hypothetical protein